MEIFLRYFHLNHVKCWISVSFWTKYSFLINKNVKTNVKPISFIQNLETVDLVVKSLAESLHFYTLHLFTSYYNKIPWKNNAWLTIWNARQFLRINAAIHSQLVQSVECLFSFRNRNKRKKRPNKWTSTTQKNHTKTNKWSFSLIKGSRMQEMKTRRTNNVRFLCVRGCQNGQLWTIVTKYWKCIQIDHRRKVNHNEKSRKT